MKRTHSLLLGTQLSLTLFVSALLSLSAPSSAGEAAGQTDFKKAAQDVNTLAADVFDNALRLQQSINDFVHKKTIDDHATELVIYVSAKAPDKTSPNKLRVEIKLDGNVLATGEYGANELSALTSGMSHKLYLGNIAPGSHDLVVELKEENGSTHITNHGALRFEKNATRKALELSVELSDKDAPPEVVFIEHS